MWADRPEVASGDVDITNGEDGTFTIIPRANGQRTDCVTRSLAHQLHTAADLELCQQRRDVELHGALGKIQARGNFLIGQALHQTGQHFLLAAGKIHAAAHGLPCFQELVRFFV